MAMYSVLIHISSSSFDLERISNILSKSQTLISQLIFITPNSGAKISKYPINIRKKMKSSFYM